MLVPYLILITGGVFVVAFARALQRAADKLVAKLVAPLDEKEAAGVTAAIRLGGIIWVCVAVWQLVTRI